MAQHPGFIVASEGDASTTHRRGKITVEIRLWAPAWVSRAQIQEHVDAAVAKAIAELNNLWPSDEGDGR